MAIAIKTNLPSVFGQRRQSITHSLNSRRRSSLFHRFASSSFPRFPLSSTNTLLGSQLQLQHPSFSFSDLCSPHTFIWMYIAIFIKSRPPIIYSLSAAAATTQRRRRASHQPHFFSGIFSLDSLFHFITSFVLLNIIVIYNMTWYRLIRMYVGMCCYALSMPPLFVPNDENTCHKSA